MTTKAQVNEAVYRMAGEWFVGLDLTIEGVELGDVMKYDVLRVSGRLLEREQKGDGRSEPSNPSTTE